MKIIYDPDSDTLTVILKEGPVKESDEVREGLILDYDAEGELVSLEILDASERIRAPQSVEFQLAK